MPISFLPAIAPKLSKSQQARVNGAKSKGPVTAGGKARSSRNALKHGLTAERHAILDIENPAEYKAVYDAAVDEFRPHSLFALRMVEKLAHLDWRIERLAILETAYLNYKIKEAAGLTVPQKDPLTEAAEQADEFGDLVRGWISAVGSLNSLDLLRRYTATLQHQFNTTFSNFEKLETRAIARRRDRELDPSFLPPYQKPEFQEPPVEPARTAPEQPAVFIAESSAVHPGPKNQTPVPAPAPAPANSRATPSSAPVGARQTIQPQGAKRTHRQAPSSNRRPIPEAA